MQLSLHPAPPIVDPPAHCYGNGILTMVSLAVRTQVHTLDLFVRKLDEERLASPVVDPTSVSVGKV